VLLQLNVKLFVFENKTQSWVERGLGLLRLNDRCLPSDASSFQSRLGLHTRTLLLFSVVYVQSCLATLPLWLRYFVLLRIFISSSLHAGAILSAVDCSVSWPYNVKLTFWVFVSLGVVLSKSVVCLLALFCFFVLV